MTPPIADMKGPEAFLFALEETLRLAPNLGPTARMEAARLVAYVKQTHRAELPAGAP